MSIHDTSGGINACTGADTSTGPIPNDLDDVMMIPRASEDYAYSWVIRTPTYMDTSAFTWTSDEDRQQFWEKNRGLWYGLMEERVIPRFPLNLPPGGTNGYLSL